MASIVGGDTNPCYKWMLWPDGSKCDGFCRENYSHNQLHHAKFACMLGAAMSDKTRDGTCWNSVFGADCLKGQDCTYNHRDLTDDEKDDVIQTLLSRDE